MGKSQEAQQARTRFCDGEFTLSEGYLDGYYPNRHDGKGMFNYRRDFRDWLGFCL